MALPGERSKHALVQHSMSLGWQSVCMFVTQCRHHPGHLGVPGDSQRAPRTTPSPAAAVEAGGIPLSMPTWLHAHALQFYLQLYYMLLTANTTHGCNPYEVLTSVMGAAP